HSLANCSAVKSLIRNECSADPSTGNLLVLPDRIQRRRDMGEVRVVARGWRCARCQAFNRGLAVLGTRFLALSEYSAPEACGKAGTVVQHRPPIPEPYSGRSREWRRRSMR